MPKKILIKSPKKLKKTLNKELEPAELEDEEEVSGEVEIIKEITPAKVKKVVEKKPKYEDIDDFLNRLEEEREFGGIE